jgi:tRNA threonylcarbamoyladenosine biosynthesis protein TsaB
VFVLAIDTSSPAVTAAVVTLQGAGAAGDGTAPDVAVVAERAPLAARGHGELLAPSIAECLHDAGLAPRDVAAVVAGTGPGPFTGLRVGLVTAAAFAQAVGVPTYGVCSLDAVAAAGADEPGLLVATDARRHEVYWARYEQGRRVDGPAVAAPADVALDGVTAVAGAAGELYADVWAPLRRRAERYPDPIALVRCAAERIVTHAPGEPLTPLYLRRPDAVVPGAPKTVTR